MKINTNVVMGQKAKNKAQALTLLGRATFEQGLTSDDYTEALQLREAQVSTYLGGGIAIPHGLPEFKDNVLKTGLVAMHFADGVDWGDGETVYLAVAIIAKSDEHLAVLRQLAGTLQHEAKTKEALMGATAATDILALLGQNDADATLSVLEHYDVVAQDGEQLLAYAVSVLKKAGAATQGFLSGVVTKPWLELAPLTYCVQERGALPALAVVGSSTPIRYGDKVLQYLLVMTGHHLLDKQRLDEVLQRAMTGQLGATAYHETTVSVPNRHGLHARPATTLAKLASTLGYEVSVSADGGEFVPAKSLTKLLSLGAGFGATLRFRTQQGNDLSLLVAAVEGGLGETVDVPLKTKTPSHLVAQTPNPAKITHGVPIYAVTAATGLAYAKAWVVKDKGYQFHQESDNPDQETQRLNRALSQVDILLDELVSTAKNQAVADIFVAHQAILTDEILRAEVLDKIIAGQSAEAAWVTTIDELASVQAALDNPLLAERATDLKDVGRRVLSVLVGDDDVIPTGAYVLVKEDLLPSDVLGLGGQMVGIITAMGSKNSHSAIIAKSLGIPALVGAGADVLTIDDGEWLLLDAQSGYFVVNPDEQMTTIALDKQAVLLDKAKTAKAHAKQPAITQDGHTIKVMANLGDVSASQAARDNGAEGVGLLRTEFVFMQHDKLPDRQAQIDDYRQVFEVMAPYPVVARTLDVGGDKPLPYLTMNSEDNPFLGVRGVRLTLQRPEILREQLIALLVAAQGHQLRIMFPMIGQLQEWRQAKAIIDEVVCEYPHNDLQVGMMIEVPSAAMMADVFAKEVDFFSIGTNDLTQYVLAIDRGHPILSANADSLHPSVLRLIDHTIKSAHQHGKWVGVCGELAADELGIAILLGLGVDELSVAGGQVAATKAHIRTLTLTACQTLATKALTQGTEKMVRDLVKR